MKLWKKSIALVGVGALVLAGLSACAEINVLGAGGVGTCNGNAVSVVTSQNSYGDDFTVTYTGPTNVGLFFVHGFYTDQPIFSYTDPILFGVADNNDAKAIKLDPTDPGWSTSGSGNSTTYTFSGSLSDLLNGESTYFDDEGGGMQVLNELFPLVIGVDCDATDATGYFTGGGSGVPLTDLEFAAAQPLFPNHMKMTPFEIVDSTPTAGGADVTMKYSAQGLADFGSFAPEAPFSLTFIADDPDIPNTDMSDLWLQVFSTFNGNNPSATVGTPNGDGTFPVSFTGYNSDPLPSGDYLLLAFISNSGQSAYKVVFASMKYDAVNGFSIVDPFAPVEEAAPTLAETGPNTAGIVAGAVSGASLIIIGAGLFLLRRRFMH